VTQLATRPRCLAWNGAQAIENRRVAILPAPRARNFRKRQGFSGMRVRSGFASGPEAPWKFILA